MDRLRTWTERARGTLDRAQPLRHKRLRFTAFFSGCTVEERERRRTENRPHVSRNSARLVISHVPTNTERDAGRPAGASMDARGQPRP